VFGTVSASRRHYDQAADALAAADPDRLAGLVTRLLAIWHRFLTHGAAVWPSTRSCRSGSQRAEGVEDHRDVDASCSSAPATGGR
jgi:hypothetical protein